MGSRVYFEKFLCEDDFKYFSNLAFNEKVMLMNYGRVFSLEEAKYIYELMLKRNKKYKEFGDFKVIERSSNEFIGYAALIPNDTLNEIEVEYMLLPEYWRRGYGSEILKELLNRIEKVMTIKKIIANIDPNNIGSKKILLNNGFNSCKIYKNVDDGSLVEMFIKNNTVIK